MESTLVYILFFYKIGKNLPKLLYIESEMFSEHNKASAMECLWK